MQLLKLPTTFLRKHNPQMPFSVNTPDKVIYFILPTRRSHYFCTKTNICLIMKDEYDAPLTNALAKNVDSKGLEGYL